MFNHIKFTTEQKGEVELWIATIKFESVLHVSQTDKMDLTEDIIKHMKKILERQLCDFITESFINYLLENTKKFPSDSIQCLLDDTLQSKSKIYVTPLAPINKSLVIIHPKTEINMLTK